MRTPQRSSLLAVGLTLFCTALAAHEPQPHATPAAPASAAAVPPGSPTAAVDAFHAALAAGDRQAALALLDAKVVIFESGGAEMSRDEYATHHLDADMQFTRAVSTEIVHREAHEAGDAAWVLSRTQTKGRFRDRDIDTKGVETIVLRRDGGQWRLVHIHWSSGGH